MHHKCLFGFQTIKREIELELHASVEITRTSNRSSYSTRFSYQLFTDGGTHVMSVGVHQNFSDWEFV
jgi:hypothetical protein